MFKLTPLFIDGSYLFESTTHKDERGYFREWFKSSTLNEFLKREFKVEQANISKSKKGVIRGIHFSSAPRGQAKWVACAAGALTTTRHGAQSAVPGGEEVRQLLQQQPEAGCLRICTE